MTKNCCPDHIQEMHFKEWVEGSGVSPEITALNVRSLSDPHEIDKALNRNTQKRWKHWDGGPGWLVTGVDPVTGERYLLGCQFKPDFPAQRIENGCLRFRKDGSPDYQKYLNASGYEAEPIFLEAPGFIWLEVIQNSAIPIFIMEGPKKSGAGLTLGKASISLPGVACGQKKGELKSRLAQFLRAGRTVTICFDADQLTNSDVQRELDRLGRLISATGSVVRVVIFPDSGPGKLDDFLVAHGRQKTLELIDSAIPFELWRAEFRVPEAKAQKDEREDLRAAATEISDMATGDPTIEYFQDELTQEFFVSLPAKFSDPGGPRITASLQSSEYEGYLRLLYKKVTKRTAPMEAAKLAIADISAKMQYFEVAYSSYPVGRRCIRVEDTVYYDLADPGGHYITISASGWEVGVKDQSCPVRFLAGRNFAPLPIPDRGSPNLDALDYWFPKGSKERAVALAWILSSYLGTPYWLLLLTGSPGSGKTTLAKILISIVDPKPQGKETRTRPREARDLATAAANNYVVCFDNLSSIGSELSDIFCVCLTGGSASERKMATNFIESSAILANPIVITAVGNPISAPDLLSRSQIIELEPRTENEDLDYQFGVFQEKLPSTLAAIFDALSDGLAGESEIPSKGLGRQIKAYKVAIAAAESLGFTQEDMRSHLLGSAEQVADSALDSGFAQALIAFLKQRPKPHPDTWNELSATLSDKILPDHYWTGGSNDLMLALGSAQRPRPIWMKSQDPRWLGRELKQLTGPLAKAGIKVIQLPRSTGSNRPYLITLVKCDQSDNGCGF